jgi:hypothetical protein
MSSRYSEARDGSQGARNIGLGRELLKEPATGCNIKQGPKNRPLDAPKARALVWPARLQRAVPRHREAHSRLDHPRHRGARAGFERDAPLGRD